MTDTYQVLRIINIVLYLLILAGFWRHRETFITAKPRLRMLLVGIGLLMITGLYSSVEILALDVPGGPRVIVLCVPLGFLVCALHMDLAFVIARWIKKKLRRRG